MKKRTKKRATDKLPVQFYVSRKQHGILASRARRAKVSRAELIRATLFRG